MKDKIISILFVSVLFVVGFSFVLKNEKDLSFYERRKLVTSENLKKDFFENLDEYMSDQFPLRDELISLNGVMERYVLQNKEKNNVYILNDYLIEKNYPLNIEEVDGFIKKINYINDKYLTNSNVFYSVIPDKSYYLGKEYLKLDFEKLMSELNNGIHVNYIDIMDKFVLEDYFKTDIHLKQDSYFKIMDDMNKYLKFDYDPLEYKKYTYDNFYGSSVSKVGSYLGGEGLDYYSNKFILNAKVKHLEYGEKQVYDEDMLSGMDSYNLFLSGPSALLEIENDKSDSDRELIIFRDSFGSSFAPLLIPYYKKITLIDLRYINMDLIPNYVAFSGSDVLFLYSSLIVNSSNLLKVKIK